MSDPNAPRYMSLETLAEALDVGPSTIEAWVSVGKFPAPKKIGPNGMRRWSWSEVQRTIEGEPQQATDILGRIKNATREEVLRRDHRRGVRERNQGVSGVSQVSGTWDGDTKKLPESPVVG